MSLLGYEDPDLKFDTLPQPYRKINNIVEDLLKGVFDYIFFPSRDVQLSRRVQQEKYLEEKAPQLHPSTLILPHSILDFGSITCTLVVPVGDGTHILIIGNTVGQIFSVGLENNQIYGTITALNTGVTELIQVVRPEPHIALVVCINAPSGIMRGYYCSLVNTAEAPYGTFVVTNVTQQQGLTTVQPQVVMSLDLGIPLSSVRPCKDSHHIALTLGDSSGTVHLYALVPSVAAKRQQFQQQQANTQFPNYNFNVIMGVAPPRSSKTIRYTFPVTHLEIAPSTLSQTSQPDVAVLDELTMSMNLSVSANLPNQNSGEYVPPPSTAPTTAATKARPTTTASTLVSQASTIAPKRKAKPPVAPPAAPPAVVYVNNNYVPTGQAPIGENPPNASVLFSGKQLADRRASFMWVWWQNHNVMIRYGYTTAPGFIFPLFIRQDQEFTFPRNLTAVDVEDSTLPLLATGHEEGSIILWDAITGYDICFLSGGVKTQDITGKSVQSLKITSSGNNRYVFSLDGRNCASVYKLNIDPISGYPTSGTQLFKLQSPKEEPTASFRLFGNSPIIILEMPNRLQFYDFQGKLIGKIASSESEHYQYKLKTTGQSIMQMGEKLLIPSLLSEVKVSDAYSVLSYNLQVGGKEKRKKKRADKEVSKDTLKMAESVYWQEGVLVFDILSLNKANCT